MKTKSYTTGLRLLGLSFILCVGLPGQAAIQVAGQLLIDLHVSRGLQISGTNVTGWQNFGTVGGAFVSSGADPYLQTAAGIAAPTFNGHRLETPFDAPPAITGQSTPGIGNTFSIEVWAYPTSADDEHCMFNWGPRLPMNGCGGTGQFNYGPNASTGATTHWCRDMSWTTVPPTNQWHHLVVTFDGQVESVYANGELNNSQVFYPLDPNPEKILNIEPGHCVLGMGKDTWGDYEVPFIGSIAALRVHSGVLTSGQITNNFEIGFSAMAAVCSGRIVISNDDVIISFDTVAGLRYKVQYSDSMLATSWLDVPPGAQTASSTSSSVIDRQAVLAGNKRFYRIVQVP